MCSWILVFVHSMPVTNAPQLEKKTLDKCNTNNKNAKWGLQAAQLLT